MSQVVTSAAQSIYEDFGIQAIGTSPITLRKDDRTRSGGIEAIGSPVGDIIRPLDLNSTTPWTVTGGLGADDVSGAAGSDSISGGDDNDAIDGNAGDDNLSGDKGNDSVLGGAGNDTVSGGEGDDLVVGGEGDDALSGDAGADLIFGGEGGDNITGGEGADKLRGNTGNDDVSGGAGNDNITGDRGNDKLDGGSGDDQVSGGSGNDQVGGGGGKDMLIGGGGKDTFVFGAGGGVDRIKDFKAKDDTIQLAQSLLPGSGLKIGQLNAGDFQVVDKITEAQAKLVYEKSSGTLYYNPASGANVPLVMLNKNLSGLSAKDVQIIEG
jgi:Ca2+-binding RTX toxin-like protein